MNDALLGRWAFHIPVTELIQRVGRNDLTVTTLVCNGRDVDDPDIPQDRVLAHRRVREC